MRRNEVGLPEQTRDAPGCALDRNPGVAAVWLTERVFYSRITRLFTVDEPLAVEWWAEGRTATRAEVLASIGSGIHLLRQACEEEAEAERAEAHAALDQQIAAAMTLLPA